MVTATKQEKETLEQLVEPTRLKTAVEIYQKYSEWYMTFDQFEKLANSASGFSSGFTDGLPVAMNNMGEIGKVRFLGIWWHKSGGILGYEQPEVEKSIADFIDIQKGWEKRFAEADKYFEDMIRGFVGSYGRASVLDIPDKILQSDIVPEEKKLRMAVWIKDTNLVEKMMLAQYVARLDRFRALRAVDQDTARDYIRSVPRVHGPLQEKLKRLMQDEFLELSGPGDGIRAARKLHEISEREGIVILPHPQEIVDYIKGDMQMYKDVLCTIDAKAA